MTLRAERTQYAVPDWGVGELWTDDGLVLAHEFAFQSVSDTEGATLLTPSHTSSRGRLEDRMQCSQAESAPACGAIYTDKAPFALDTNWCLTPMEIVERLTEFLAGDEQKLADIPLDLDWTTPFQRAVADVLRGVPRGEVVSYGELAALAGHPGAARAVGTFCARNRLMFFIPCHRVVGAAGLGGYGSAGVDVKRRLLGIEGFRL